MKTKKICPGFKKGKNGYCENWTAEKKWRSCRSDCSLVVGNIYENPELLEG